MWLYRSTNAVFEGKIEIGTPGGGSAEKTLGVGREAEVARTYLSFWTLSKEPRSIHHIMRVIGDG